MASGEIRDHESVVQPYESMSISPREHPITPSHDIQLQGFVAESLTEA